jgi:hypothetical protein
MTNRRVALYLRVSTVEQDVTNQRRELEAVARRHDWRVVAVFSDNGVSGAKGRAERPGLNQLMTAVARRDVDVVAAWSVDRLGRSLQGLLEVLMEFRAKGIDLYLHQQGIDTSTPGGKADVPDVGRLRGTRAGAHPRAGCWRGWLGPGHRESIWGGRGSTRTWRRPFGPRWQMGRALSGPPGCTASASVRCSGSRRARRGGAWSQGPRRMVPSGATPSPRWVPSALHRLQKF